MAWLTEIGGRTRVVALVTPGSVRFGRAEDNDVVLADDLKVSRRHTEILCRQGTWWARDCGSRNGTLVNGSKIADVELVDGDRVRIASSEFIFSESEDPLATMDDSTEAVLPTALSPREREVLAWVASGATDTQIARGLGIGLATVHSHLDRMREKTGRRRRPDLTRLAAEIGLQLPDRPPG